MFLVIIKIVLILITEPASQIGKVKAIIETKVLVLTLAFTITKLSFLCT